MKDKITKLIDVKTIITFTLLFSYVGLIYLNKIVPEPLTDLLKTAIIFYFGMKQGEKKAGE